MKLRYLFLAFALSAVVGAAAFVAANRPDTYQFHYDNILGTSLDVTVRATSDAAAHQAESAILAQIDHDARILSSYDPDSEFSRWFRTQGEAVRVSPELMNVLALFDTWRDRTGGALDASAENIARVWRTAATERRLPAAQDLAVAVAGVHQQHWILDRTAGTATHLTMVPLMLNSFTKSYIVSRAADAAMAVARVDAAIVNVGGDLVARGDWPETVGITDPRHDADNAEPMTQLVVQNKAVATSGGYRRGFDIGGQHFSHIVDPRTGQPTGHVLSATVVADNAVDAGALATSFCVLRPEESEQLATTVKGAEFLLVLADGSRIESAGWLRLETRPSAQMRLPSPVASLYAAEQATTWQGMELTVNVELARQFGKRPYLAVWVEDKDHFPVRTIALWYNGERRYLPEMRGWYRSDRLRALAEGKEIVNTVSSATRSPGKYILTWDGKDGAGKIVNPGPYTVIIECAREHGTYQITRQEMDFSGTPKQVDLAPNTEIASMSLDYHKVAGR